MGMFHTHHVNIFHTHHVNMFHTHRGNIFHTHLDNEAEELLLALGLGNKRKVCLGAPERHDVREKKDFLRALIGTAPHALSNKSRE